MSDEPEQLSKMDMAVMEAEYGILLNKFLTACQGANPRVAMAALMGTAGTIAVQACNGEVMARNFLYACVNDVCEKLGPAFKHYTQERIAKEAARNGSLDS